MDKNNLLESLLEDPKFRDWVEKGKYSDHWEKWKENHPGEVEILDDARAIILGIPAKIKKVDEVEIDRSFNALKEMKTKEKPFVRKKIALGWLKYAAGIVIIIVAGLFFWNDFQFSKSESAVFSVNTLPGQVKNVSLPDSSFVVLNGNTKIEYVSDSETRNIILDGEAHFKVQEVEKRSGHKKFVIKTPDLSVEVLGTTFSVSNDSIWTTVVLEEGEVLLKGISGDASLGGSYIMKPGEKVVFNSLNNSFSTEKLDAIRYNSWTSQKLSLVNRSVEELVRWFDHNYSIKLQIPKEYSDRELTGSVDLTNRETAIKMIAIALELHPQKKSDSTWYFK